MAILTVNSIALPAPTTITVGDEIIWSANTGRISTGQMIGDVIAEKQTLSVIWEYLTAAEKNTISNNLKAGFFPITIDIDGNPYEITSYRGVMTSDAIGKLSDGVYYFRQVSCDIVQQ